MKAEESVVPPPEDFNVVIQREAVSGGELSPYALVTWTIPANGGSLSYEIEYQKADLSEAVQSFRVEAGRTEARTPYLPDGVEYRFRMRSLGNGTPSAWTADINRTPVSDASAPASPINMQAINSGGTILVSAQSANDNTRYLVFRRARRLRASMTQHFWSAFRFRQTNTSSWTTLQASARGSMGLFREHLRGAVRDAVELDCRRDLINALHISN